MNDLPKLFYCNVGKCVYDTHGKVYEIKEHRNWKFVNFDNKKIGVSSLPVKLKLFNFDDFQFNYIFGGLFNQFPCIAMEYLIYRRITKKNISANQYKKMNT